MPTKPRWVRSRCSGATLQTARVAASCVRAIYIGLAMSVDDGVVAPVIQNADKATLGEIAVQRRDLAERARGGKLRPGDLHRTSDVGGRWRGGAGNSECRQSHAG